MSCTAPRDLWPWLLGLMPIETHCQELWCVFILTLRRCGVTEKTSFIIDCFGFDPAVTDPHYYSWNSLLYRWPVCCRWQVDVIVIDESSRLLIRLVSLYWPPPLWLLLLWTRLCNLHSSSRIFSVSLMIENSSWGKVLPHNVQKNNIFAFH